MVMSVLHLFLCWFWSSYMEYKGRLIFHVEEKRAISHWSLNPHSWIQSNLLSWYSKSYPCRQRKLKYPQAPLPKRIAEIEKKLLSDPELTVNLFPQKYNFDVELIVLSCTATEIFSGQKMIHSFKKSPDSVTVSSCTFHRSIDNTKETLVFLIFVTSRVNKI